MSWTFRFAHRLVPAAATLGILGVDLGDITGFFRGMEFRLLLTQILTEVTTGVADAVIETLILASFGVLE